MTPWDILILPVSLSILVGLAIGIPLIRFGRKHGWSEYLFITHKQFLAKCEAAFHGRTPLTPDEYYEAYFGKSGIPKEIPVRVRRIFEEHFDADFSRLKDDDDFTKELSFFWDYDSFVDVEIVLALEEEFGIEISDKEATEMKSVRAIVETIWKKKACP
jgi:acyl carrier protein